MLHVLSLMFLLLNIFLKEDFKLLISQHPVNHFKDNLFTPHYQAGQ
jgi:hypothetical protein